MKTIYLLRWQCRLAETPNQEVEAKNTTALQKHKATREEILTRLHCG